MFSCCVSRNIRKGAIGYVRPAKIQINLCIRAVCSESSLRTIWISKDANIFHSEKEDFDHTAQMHRLILRLRWTHMSEGTISDVAAHRTYVAATVKHAPSKQKTTSSIFEMLSHVTTNAVLTCSVP